MSASRTHGFLFADLRGYTAYLDRRGAVDAAALLARFRALVRSAVAVHEGAEIRTEGDSFYVVFPSASMAVACALDIVTAATAQSRAAGGDPIPVGIGVHAGEAVDTPEGPVGTAVNIAARLCAIAKPGEVVVSDTVRALTRSIGSAAFEPLGRRRLKGIDEPVVIYRAVPIGEARPGRPVRRPPRRLVGAVGFTAVGAAAVIALTALVAPSLLAPPGASPPMTGTSSAAAAQPSRSDAAIQSASARLSSPGFHQADQFALPFEITLGRDWTRSLQQADHVVFFHPEPPSGWLDVLVVAATHDPPCPSTEPAFIGNRPEDVIEWLTTRTWLDHDAPRPYNVGRYVGRAVAIEVPTADRWSCADRPLEHAATFFRLGGSPGGTRRWGAEIGERKLMIAIDVGGRTVTLVLGSPDPDVEQLWKDTEPLLQSMRFLDR